MHLCSFSSYLFPKQQAELENMAAAVPSLNSRLLALASLSMGFSLISSAFGFYYVKVFLDYFHIQESWFQFAQVSYLILQETTYIFCGIRGILYLIIQFCSLYHFRTVKITHFDHLAMLRNKKQCRASVYQTI